MSSPPNHQERSPQGEASQDTTPGGTTPRRKEKKRVGFHDDGNSRPTSLVIDDNIIHELPHIHLQQPQEYQHQLQQPLLRQQPVDDGDGTNPFATPSASPKRESATGPPDAAELRRALSLIHLTPEGRAFSSVGTSSGTSDGTSPAVPGSGSSQRHGPMPRPVLKRNTSYDVPEEREQADIAEQNTSAREHLSGLAARERAHNLAVRVAESQRPSFDSDEEADIEGRPDRPSTAHPHRHGSKGKTSEAGGTESKQVRTRPRQNSQRAAESLVRTHTMRLKSGAKQPDYFTYQPPAGSRSGATTPVTEQEYAHDYVPPPTKYQGGILGSLLKLYKEGGNSGASTGANTPVATTPNASPPESAVSSRPTTPRGGGHSRQSSGTTIYGEGGSLAPPRPPAPRSASSPGGLGLGLGIGGHHRRGSSQSPIALAELMKSTSTLVAPGSSSTSGGISDKIKTEVKKRRSGLFGSGDASSAPGDGGGGGKHKSKKQKSKEEQIRITIHIAQILSRHKYLVKLCRALMMYGAPTHRLEEYMTMSARVLEIEGQFLYLPGSMIISFDDSATHTTEVKIVRAPQGVDLGKLHDVHNIYKQVIHDRISADEATASLDAVMGRGLKFGNWARVPVYGLASACVAPFAFEGRFVDLPVAFVLGCILGWLQLILAPSNELYANVFEISASILTSFLARALGSIPDPRSGEGDKLFCFSALAQSSIALILPGYMVLCSALELQSHHIIAGSVRLVYAIIYMLFLGYGTTLGVTLYGLLDPQHATSATSCSDPLHRNWYLLFVPLFTLCLCVINQAKWSQTPVMLSISLAGFLVNSYAATYFQDSTQISNMLGALTVGLMANLYSRVGRHVENAWYGFLDWWDLRVRPRFSSVSRRRNEMRRRMRKGLHGGVDGDGGRGGYGAPGAVDEDEAFRTHRADPSLRGGVSDDSSVPGTPETATFPHSATSSGASTPVEKHTSTSEEAATARPSRRVRHATSSTLAAAAMLPAIFVQVPSGLAASGSLLAGVTTANQITKTNSTLTNGTATTTLAATAATATGTGSGTSSVDISSLSSFTPMVSVIQITIGITVGLFISALVVYPLGKRRSGLLSF